MSISTTRAGRQQSAIRLTGSNLDPRWAAVVARDPKADGEFVYAVKTTGVYCRPSCPSRLAKRENVEFHASRAEAERAGFRPCKRCRPDRVVSLEGQAASVAEVVALRTNPRQRTNGEIQFAIDGSSLGHILVARSDQGICAILMGDDPDGLVRDLSVRFPQTLLSRNDAQLRPLAARVVGFVEAPRASLDLPLDIRGTAFQRRVWQALRQIPVGCTASYTEIAQRIGAPKSVRAVAQACGANPIALAVPCHRVVRNDGALSGYRWGIERKRALLEREAAR